MGVAILPMYDWPEVHSENDRLWADMREALRREGIDAPEQLDRSLGYADSWRRDDLVLSQACGLPFARELIGQVAYIGTIDFALAGCERGFYYSHVVVPKRSKFERRDLSGRRFAFNSACSQSGFACLKELGLADGEALETGGHRESLTAVAGGDAEFAAIDANTWRLAARFEPAFEQLRILFSTPAKPAPVLIAAKGVNVEGYRRALDVVPFDPSIYRELL